MTTREMLEQAYEDATGLDVRRAAARIDNLEKWINEHDLENFTIFNDPNKPGRDYNRDGTRWYAGAENGDTICLGYTSARQAFAYKNAVFAKSDEITLDSE